MTPRAGSKIFINRKGQEIEIPTNAPILIDKNGDENYVYSITQKQVQFKNIQENKVYTTTIDRGLKIINK